jgi:hypothetical protein
MLDKKICLNHVLNQTMHKVANLLSQLDRHHAQQIQALIYPNNTRKFKIMLFKNKNLFLKESIQLMIDLLNLWLKRNKSRILLL